MSKPIFIVNSFGPDWLEKLKRTLPAIEGLNISNEKVIIDGNRRFLLIQGHKIKGSNSYLSQTIISSFEDSIKIETKIRTPYLIMWLIAPTLVIAYVWYGYNLITALLTTSIFIWNPIYCLADVRKQYKFGKILGREIEISN
jgi:hypothetical protein